MYPRAATPYKTTRTSKPLRIKRKLAHFISSYRMRQISKPPGNDMIVEEFGD